MVVAISMAICLLAFGQEPDPAYQPLTQAYAALRARDYDTAIDAFKRGSAAAPKRASIRKDLAYTYLKVGENAAARDEFHEAMRLDPTDTQAALEYAFLCNETGEQAEARRVFDRVRKSGNATAEAAFENIDRPLREGIDRWQRAIAAGADNFSAHFELATLADRRDQLDLAAAHYEKAWRLLPDRRSVLVALGRVWRTLNRSGDATAALLAASRGGEPRAAEAARELLPARYPFVSEFRAALQLDPKNGELRRELAYLFLRMGRQPEAESEFRILVQTAPDDLLSATQLGFLLYARGDHEGAKPLFERVLNGKDDDLANRVRAVLRLPQVLRTRPQSPPASIDAKLMAERSAKAGYMKDALKYLEIAHEADPVDFEVMLRLGWTYNILRQDQLAVRWFELASKSPDPVIAAEASHAFRNLRGSLARFRVSAWAFPVFSTRWDDLFSYAQVKTEVRTAFPVHPYVSIRFIGDTRQTIGEVSPQYLSETSFILAAGVATRPWHGLTLWGEAGSAINYSRGSMLPDYRGGMSYFRGFGRHLEAETPGWFFETAADGVYISRFGNDFLVYSQNRAGRTVSTGMMRTQLYWNGNATVDRKREYWANYFETGPGIRLRPSLFPSSTYFTVNVLRGSYMLKAGNPKGPKFDDLRAGFWYAFSH